MEMEMWTDPLNSKNGQIIHNKINEGKGEGGRVVVRRRVNTIVRHDNYQWMVMNTISMV
jgi:hypothetical protein